MEEATKEGTGEQFETTPPPVTPDQPVRPPVAEPHPLTLDQPSDHLPEDVRGDYKTLTTDLEKFRLNWERTKRLVN